MVNPTSVVYGFTAGLFVAYSRHPEGGISAYAVSIAIGLFVFVGWDVFLFLADKFCKDRNREDAPSLNAETKPSAPASPPSAAGAREAQAGGAATLDGKTGDDIGSPPAPDQNAKHGNPPDGSPAE